MSWLSFAWSRLGGMFLAGEWALVDILCLASLAELVVTSSCKLPFTGVSRGLGMGDQGEGHGSDAGHRVWG